MTDLNFLNEISICFSVVMHLKETTGGRSCRLKKY